MGYRHWLLFGVAGTLILALPETACANSLSPVIWFWPGILHLVFAYAFPASVLAAVCERPFVCRAGITQYPLLMSLRANFLSMLLGIGLMYGGLPYTYGAIYGYGPLLPAAIFLISVVSEGAYYYWVAQREGRDLRWGPVFQGNIVSNLILIVVVPAIAAIVADISTFLPHRLRDYEYDLAWTGIVSSGVCFALSLVPISVWRFLHSFVVSRVTAETRREIVGGSLGAVVGIVVGFPLVITHQLPHPFSVSVVAALWAILVGSLWRGGIGFIFLGAAVGCVISEGLWPSTKLNPAAGAAGLAPGAIFGLLLAVVCDLFAKSTQTQRPPTGRMEPDRSIQIAP